MSDSRARLRAEVAEMPRVQWLWFEHDWVTGRDVCAFGAAWDRNFDALPGERVYRRCVIVRFVFRFAWLGLEWRVRKP